jgi:AcrR family transcriptional regulator
VQSGDRSRNQETRSFIEAARRAQIVRSAITTIADVGYAQASFARIAERAGVSAALISYHFAGKTDLIDQVVTDIVDSMRAAIEAGADSAASYRDALRAVVAGQVRYFAEHSAETLALAAIRAASEPGIADSAWTQRIRSLAEIEEMLRAGQAAGEFRPFPVGMMAATILAALEAIPAELRRTPATGVEVYATELATALDLATRSSRKPVGTGRSRG